MRLFLQRLRKHEGGAIAVETAFVVPAFILLILGIMELCRAYWVLDSIQLAIDDAGRYAMLRSTATNAQIISTAKASLHGLNSNLFTVTVTSQASGGVSYKVITASYTFNFVAPGVLPYGNITLSRSTTVPVIP